MVVRRKKAIWPCFPIAFKSHSLIFSVQLISTTPNGWWKAPEIKHVFLNHPCSCSVKTQVHFYLILDLTAFIYFSLSLLNSASKTGKHIHQASWSKGGRGNVNDKDLVSDQFIFIFLSAFLRGQSVCSVTFLGRFVEPPQNYVSKTRQDRTKLQ